MCDVVEVVLGVGIIIDVFFVVIVVVSFWLCLLIVVNK